MAKIVINGEAFDYDGAIAPLSEALEIERVLGIRYAQWEDDLSAGSMTAMAAFVWKVWHRDGRDISLQDVVDGKAEVELAELLTSLTELAREREAQEEAPKETPTGPAGTPGTGTGTSGRSRNGSASGPGKSASSTSPTSRS